MFTHVQSSLGNLLTTEINGNILFTCWKASLQSNTACETPSGGFEVRNNNRFDSNCLHCFVQTIGKLQRKRLFQSHAIDLCGTERCMDNSCKQRAYRSFVIVHTERCQWQASFTQEKLACLTEVSVTEQILWKFSNSQIPRNPGGTEHVQTVCTKLFFSAYAQEVQNEAN